MRGRAGSPRHASHAARKPRPAPKPVSRIVKAVRPPQRVGSALPPRNTRRACASPPREGWWRSGKSDENGAPEERSCAGEVGTVITRRFYRPRNPFPRRGSLPCAPKGVKAPRSIASAERAASGTDRLEQDLRKPVPELRDEIGIARGHVEHGEHAAAPDVIPENAVATGDFKQLRKGHGVVAAGDAELGQR